MSSDGAGRLTGTKVTSSGKLFQTLPPAIGKAQKLFPYNGINRPESRTIYVYVPCFVVFLQGAKPAVSDCVLSKIVN